MQGIYMQEVNGRLSATLCDLSPLSDGGVDVDGFTDWDVHHLLLSLRGGDSAATRSDAACCTDVFNRTIGAGAAAGAGGGGGSGSGVGLSLDPGRFEAKKTERDALGKPCKKIKLVARDPVAVVAGFAAPTVVPPRDPVAGFAAPTVVPPRVELPSASLKALEVPCQAPAVSVSIPKTPTKCLVLTQNQKARLQRLHSPLLLFRLYTELYPGKQEEIKAFFFDVFHQYSIKNLSCTIDKEEVWWNEFEEEVRGVCGFEFLIFQDFLTNCSDVIMCVFRNLKFYKPGVIKNYFSEIKKREGEEMPFGIEDFIRGIISIYGTSLGPFKPNIPIPV